MSDEAHNPVLSPHLRDLENESIHILREVVGQCDKVGLLFSGGKDSCVVFELARRAFAPAPLPIELLHVDTGHNFQEVIAFRDAIVDKHDARLRVAHVQDWIDRGELVERPDGTRNPLQTVPLVETIAQAGYDAVLGGARRDEERARAKERVFSVRDSFGGWDPRRQRPELWDLYNAEKLPGENIRVFPISNWTESDVWEYIGARGIELPNIYTAEFLVTSAATAGFAVGMWNELLMNLAAVGALLAGGVVAAPIAAWVVSRANPIVLGGFVGAVIVALNLPVVLAAVGFDDELWIVRVLILAIGALLCWRGVVETRTYSKAASEREECADGGSLGVGGGGMVIAPSVVAVEPQRAG